MGSHSAPHSLSALTAADALFTKTQQRVLSAVFGNSSRSFYAREIIDRVKIGSGAVQRELAKLEASGLVTVEWIGNQKHYRANDRSPVFESLRELILKTSGVADVLRSALAPLASQIIGAFVFGSVARRDERSASDVDLLVVSNSLTFAELFEVLEAPGQTLGRVVNPTIYTQAELTTMRGKKNSFVERLMEQPKIWIYGDQNDLAAR